MADPTHVEHEALLAAIRVNIGDKIDEIRNHRLSGTAPAEDQVALCAIAAVLFVGWRPPAEGPTATAGELEQFAYSYERQAQMFGAPRDDTPAAGIQSTLVDVARELRERAKELKGEARG